MAGEGRGPTYAVRRIRPFVKEEDVPPGAAVKEEVVESIPRHKGQSFTAALTTTYPATCVDHASCEMRMTLLLGKHSWGRDPRIY